MGEEEPWLQEASPSVTLKKSGFLRTLSILALAGELRAVPSELFRNGGKSLKESRKRDYPGFPVRSFPGGKPVVFEMTLEK